MSKTKFILMLILLLFISLPLAVIVTLLIAPLWNWFESVTGIESYGHFGPADWCYLFDYAIFGIFSIVALLKSYKRVKNN
jgi:hypothetical protein